MSQIPPKGPFPSGLSAATIQAIKGAQAAFLLGLQPEEVTAASTSVASDGSIIDAAGNVWTLVSGQVAVNGTIDNATSDVIELGFYDGVFWQESSAGKWWSKASPTDAWKPASGPPV